MRYIDGALKNRIEKAHQTLYENANPAMLIRVSRHTTPITERVFWERARIAAGASSVSVATRRPNIRKESDRVYVAYCADGIGYLKYADYKADIKRMMWLDAGTINDATDIALAFDGRMEKDLRNHVNFRTADPTPWVFWIDSAGMLYGKLVGDDTTQITLATANASAVTAVRGIHSDIGNFDQGLLVFFLLSGSIYYRSYRSGTWEDATLLNFGPAVTWVDISVGRTWDYRIVIQAMDTDGDIYELFTKTEGIAKQNIERIEVKDITAEGEQIEVTYSDAQEVEHIEVTDIIATGEVIYGLSPVPLEVANIDDGTGNWGVYVTILLDYPVTSVLGNASAFVLTDGYNSTYTATSILASEDGRTLTLTMPDFNAAYETVCTLAYTPGTIQGPAVPLESFSFEFSPINLVAPIVDPPEVEAIWNE